jgi:hypothetical protein
MSAKKTPPPPKSAADGLLTVEQTQAELGISRPKLYQLARQGRLDLRKFDRKTFITRDSIDRLWTEIKSTPWTPGGAKTVKCGSQT